MTPHQIALIQSSFAEVVPITDDAAALFYRRLFEISPQTRRLFTSDMEEQGRKLLLTLATVVDSLDDLPSILPVAAALAQRHVGYGVRDEHYAAVGVALLAMLHGTLGARFDGETEAAWGTAYQFLSDTMIAATRRAA